MVKAATTGQGLEDSRLLRPRFDGPPARTVLSEPKMGSVVVVVAQEILQQPAKVLLASRDDVVQEAGPKGSVPPFDGPILPG